MFDSKIFDKNENCLIVYFVYVIGVCVCLCMVMLLTTIISEGSRTMHSHPRRRLPADRFPKLDRKKDIKRMMRKAKIHNDINKSGAVLFMFLYTL